MRKSRWVVIAVAGVILALVFVLFLYRDSFLPGEKTVLQEEPKSRGESVRKKIEIPPSKEEPPRLSDAKKPDHDIVQERVEEFFAYLDTQEYVKAYNLTDGSYRHFLGIASNLSSRLPIVSGETNDLSVLRNNMAHLLRVMGKRDVSLVLDILSNEEERIEGTMAALYEWGMREAQRKEDAMGGLYGYAVFFLDTMSGKAYLFRRAPQVRILLTYYSILTLDRANTKQLNRCGVDILPHVNLLIDDIARYNGMDRKNEYLERLDAIREKTGRRTPVVGNTLHLRVAE